jgi:hypothetical protein
MNKENIEQKINIGDFSIETIEDDMLWIVKIDGEASSFDKDLFEKCVADFFYENF